MSALGGGISRDPIGELGFERLGSARASASVGELNHYVFVLNNALQNADFHGLYIVCCDTAQVTCGSVYAFCGAQHCQISQGTICPSGRSWKAPIPIMVDRDQKRKLVGTCTTCDQVTDSQIAECEKKVGMFYTYHNFADSCQQKVANVINGCCMKTSWTPSPILVQPKCLRGHWKYHKDEFSVLEKIWVCDEYEQVWWGIKE